MEQSVILTSPLLLCLYGLALALVIIELVHKATGFVLPLLGFVVVVAATTYAVLLGASLYEAAIPVMGFLLLSLLGIRRKRE